MAKTREQKEAMFADLKGKFKGYKTIVFAGYHGIGVSELNKLRKESRAQNADYMVAKKTLSKKAFDSLDIQVPIEEYPGSFSFLGSIEDEIAPAKIIADFQKDHEPLEILGGVMDGEYVDASRIVALSKLPSKEELLAKVVGSMNSPISGFVNVLAGNMRGLVNVLNAVKDTK